MTIQLQGNNEETILGCASCNRNKKAGTYTNNDSLSMPPFRSNDMMILENDQVHKISTQDWDDNKNKVLLFVESYNGASTSEARELNNWVTKFAAIDTDVYLATSDQMHLVRDWLMQSEVAGLNYKIISSYLLPTRLNIMNNGKNKIATVFITKDSEVVVQEMFPRVGRSIQDIYRTISGYTQQDYVNADWQPIDEVGSDSAET